jgi:hypothetical protein
MPHRDSEEEDDAPPPPGFSTPMKASCNAEQDAKGTEDESDANVEKEFDELTGKKRNYNGYHSYRVIKEWATGPHSLLKEAEIQHENIPR